MVDTSTATEATETADAHPGRARYLVLCGVVVVLVAGQQLQATWSGDAWLHAAAARELSAHLLHPREPILGIDAPHPMLTPYSVVVGLVARLTGSAVDALVVMAFANLALLLWAFRRFVLELTRWRGADANDERSTFGSLVFVLVLWGPGAWRWSGFLHLGALGFVLPFPSTAAIGVTLLTLAAASRGLRTANDRWLAGLPFALAFVALSHPPTAVALALGLLAVVIGGERAPLGRRRWLLLAASLAAGVCLTLVWPFFSVLGLRPTPSFDTMNEVLLHDTVIRVAPLALGFIPLFFRLRRNRRDPLSLMAILAIGFCVVGTLAGVTVLLRLLPFVGLLLQIGCGWGAARVEVWLRGRISNGARRAIEIGAVVAIAVWGLYLGRGAIARDLPPSLAPSSLATDERLVSASDQYQSFGDALADEDIVLAPTSDSRYLVAFGGRESGSYWENPFVPDDAARRSELDRFFATTDADRDAIVRRRGVTHVLVPAGNAPTIAWLTARGATPVVDNSTSVLYRLPTR